MVSTLLFKSWEFMTDNFLFDSFSTSLALYEQGGDSNIEYFDIFTKPSNPPSKLSLVSLLVFLRKVLHVVSDMLAEDVGPVDIRIERLGLAVVSRESLLRVPPLNCQVLHQQLPSEQEKP